MSLHGHVLADYAKISTKSWVYYLEIWFRKMRICSVLLKNFKMSLPIKKNYKIIIENAFSEPEIFGVINIKCFSENFRTLSNF